MDSILSFEDFKTLIMEPGGCQFIGSLLVCSCTITLPSTFIIINLGAMEANDDALP